MFILGSIDFLCPGHGVGQQLFHDVELQRMDIEKKGETKRLLVKIIKPLNPLILPVLLEQLSLQQILSGVLVET